MAHCCWVRVGQDIHRTTYQAHLPRAIHQNRTPSPRHPASPLLRQTGLIMPEGGGHGGGRCKLLSEQRRNSTNPRRVQATIACRVFTTREQPSISTARAQSQIHEEHKGIYEYCSLRWTAPAPAVGQSLRTEKAVKAGYQQSPGELKHVTHESLNASGARKITGSGCAWGAIHSRKSRNEESTIVGVRVRTHTVILK